jgi:hypothetical protein
VRGDARAAFLALGRTGLVTLIEALDDPATPDAVRRHLPGTLSRFRTVSAAAAMVARLPHEPDGRTEVKLLRALGRMRADDPQLPIDPAPVRSYLTRAIRDAARYAMLADYLDQHRDDASPSATLIADLLAEKRRNSVEHAFRALGILYPRAGLRSAHDAFATGDEARRSAAREILAALLTAELRAPLLAVLDDLSPAQRRECIGALAPGPFASYEAFIATLLTDRSESLRCVVAAHVAERHMTALTGDLERLRHGTPLVEHAFARALEVLLHG